MSDETTLLPCPFCGGDDVNMGVRPHFREGKGNGWTVLCADCGGSIGYIERPDGHFYAEYDTKSEAIAAWNSRAERTCECVAEHVCSPFDGKTIVLHRCSVCHELMRPFMKHCPGCGAKVIEEVDNADE